jgi:branched-subunit amino acid transport protein
MPALALAGLVTFATRLSFIALLAHARTPPLLARALRLVPFAVLSAIILPELVIRDGAPHLSPDNLRLVAGLVAAGVALATRNVFLTIAAGLGALWALQALVG